MSNATNALEELIGNHLLRTATWSKPVTIFVGLFTTMPAEDGTGGAEVTGGSYARIQCGPGDAYWTGPTTGDGVYSNTGTITFPAPTDNWGTILGYGLFSAVSGGTLYISKAFDSSVVISSGAPAPGFAIGALTVTFA